jgi:hypothetical protein
MLNKNNILTGLFAGAILPAVSWVIFEYLFKATVINNKPAIPYLAVIAVNLFIMRFYIKKEADRSVQGVMIATFAFMIIVFVFKMRPQ